MRSGSTTPTLVEQNDPVILGVEITPHGRAASAPRPTMQNNNWLPIRVAALLDINFVAIPNIQHTLIERFDRRVKILDCALLVAVFIHHIAYIVP